jgi:glutathione synthase/RimK-type ligase-like ATP-grasp enzyme
MTNSNAIKIAIHHTPGSFSDKWIEYCQEKHLSYGLVNCYDDKIIEQLKSFDVLLWHWHHADTKAILFARPFFLSVKNMDIRAFPDIYTCWHFDDKVGQKYMLESIGAPLAPSHVFYDKKEALAWINKTEFPKVFKLRVGAGSTNVRLIKNFSDAEKLCKRAFGRGFQTTASYWTDFVTKMKKTHRKNDYLGKIMRLPSAILNIYLNNKMRARERGYIYFQEFIPDNKWDTRITVIGNRAFGFRRMVRKNDFRASGSGNIDYDLSRINMKCVAIAFKVAEKLQSQSMAFDFVEDKDSNPLIVEVSYCYLASAVQACPGHWDKDLNWHEGAIWPQYAIMDDLLQSIEKQVPRN